MTLAAGTICATCCGGSTYPDPWKAVGWNDRRGSESQWALVAAAGQQRRRVGRTAESRAAIHASLFRDTPRHDTPTACGTALRHKRAAKHPTYYTIWFFFFFLDHWITKLCGLLLFSIYYSPYFIFSFSPLCLLLWGCTPEKSLWSFSGPQTVREGLKRIRLIFLIYRLYLLCSLSNNYLIN